MSVVVSLDSLHHQASFCSDEAYVRSFGLEGRQIEPLYCECVSTSTAEMLFSLTEGACGCTGQLPVWNCMDMNWGNKGQKVTFCSFLLFLF